MRIVNTIKSAIIWCAHLCNQVHFAFEESLARLQVDSNMHMSGRRCWPSYPCCTMICSLKGRSVLVNSEGLGQGFCLRCQPLSKDSNWLQDVLLGVALFLVQLSTVAAWMELQTRIRPNARARILKGFVWAFIWHAIHCFRIKLDSGDHVVNDDGIISLYMCF